ncbi:MAG: HAD family hydrolase [Deltaproteobacteria bacterium]|nr:HAD family hydrolase [Deltaproteobacteria bacterium]
MIVTDCDGVLTDAGVYDSAQGEELKRFSVRDGKGVERARDGGIATVIVTGERSPAVLARARKLGIDADLGVDPKASFVLARLGECGLTPAETAYLGDDVNDLGAMALVREAGIVGAPADALPSVRHVAHRITEARGGEGAYREFVEWLLELRTSTARGLAT